MINTKKGPVKKFNNNPPKRELQKIEKEPEDEPNMIGMKHNYLVKGMGTQKSSEANLKIPAYYTNFNHGERSGSPDRDFRPPSFRQ
jgi:hypothetical protein